MSAPLRLAARLRADRREAGARRGGAAGPLPLPHPDHRPDGQLPRAGRRQAHPAGAAAALGEDARTTTSEDGDKDVRYAAVVEFIHTATLVHDDIIDEARLRRGRTSANARWGNNLTVLFGDYLYTMSMGIALDEGDLTILKVLSDTTLSMIEGEILGHGEGRLRPRHPGGGARDHAAQDRGPLRGRLPAAGPLRAPRGSRRGGAAGRVRPLPGDGVPVDRRPARLHRAASRRSASPS